jgi:hypothetical protein
LEPGPDVPRLALRPDLHEQPAEPAAYREVCGPFEEIAFLEEPDERTFGGLGTEPVELRAASRSRASLRRGGSSTRARGRSAVLSWWLRGVS